MPRKYKKRDKKAEAAARPKPPSSEWEERKKRIRDAYGVKLPELTVIACDTVFMSFDRLLKKSLDDPTSITTPAPNDIGDEII